MAEASVQKPQIQTSFIPKRQLASERVYRRSPMGFLTFLSVLIFVGSLVFWGGSFIWRSALRSEVAGLHSSLARAKEAFEPKTLQVFIDLDRKLEAARVLLNQHRVLVPLLNHLEELTIRSVRFRNFDFKLLSDGRAAVVMDGEAPNYATVALQADEFGRSNFLINPIFSDLDLEPSGKVIFRTTFSVDQNLLSYVKDLSIR